MSLDKSIAQGKECRKPYRGSKAIDPSCRNHGGCPWCIDDAEHLTVDTNRLRMVRVEAEIAPFEQITTVTYTLERAADPRIDDHNI